MNINPVMFRQFRTRLMLAFGGSIGIILIAMSCLSIHFIQETARNKVKDELNAAATVQARFWQLDEKDLLDKARTLSLDFGFRAAVATEDVPTIASALKNLKDRLGMDEAYAVLPDGRSINPESSEGEIVFAAPDIVFNALQKSEGQSGVIMVEDRRVKLVSAPVNAPRHVGWVVFVKPLDDAQFRELETLSPIPFVASINSENTAEEQSGRDIVSVREIAGFGDTPSMNLVLRYPISAAMAPYQGMFYALMATALAGLALLLACCWFIARGVTEPIRQLDIAVRKFGDSSVFDLQISSRDEIGRLAGSFRDMAEKIAEREAHITALSLTDVETEIPNRRALELALNSKISSAGRRRFVLAVGIDRFARIRDVIGQVSANDLVSMVARRLSARPEILAHGRLASDTIGFLLDAKDFVDVHDCFRSMQIGDEAFIIGSESVDVHLSAGFSETSGATDLHPIDAAMIALSQARASAQIIQPFDVDLYGNPSGTLSLMSDLMAGLKQGAVFLNYQPKYDLRGQKIIGVEALLRWIDPERGFVSPDVFVTNAEETGHIKPLTRWVVETARKDRERLSRKGFDLKFAINLSGRLVADDGFIDWIAEELKDQAGVFCLEVTETAVIADPGAALANIRRLREAGIEISIDDYGSGLSSLSYLKQIPAHELKIDKAFILEMETGSSDAFLVKSTIDLAHTLGMRVVAEGVENQQVLALLSVMGADIAQGYHIARPLKYDALLSFLEDWQVTDKFAVSDVAATSLMTSRPLV